METLTEREILLADHIVARVLNAVGASPAEAISPQVQNLKGNMSPRTMITENLLTPEQVEAIETIFEMFDIDGSGAIVSFTAMTGVPLSSAHCLILNTTL
eukprot:SAG31_NODE_4699_length_3025_cov_10.720096_2_plen_100_part_00